MTSLISDYIGLNTEVVKGSIVGEHGDSQIPIWSHVSIGGVPIEDFCENAGISWDDEQMEKISETVKNMGRTLYPRKEKLIMGLPPVSVC